MVRIAANAKAANLVLICVDFYKNSRLQGRVYHKAAPKPFQFQDLGVMILGIDGVLDSLGCPQASTQRRVFGVRKKPLPKKEIIPMKFDETFQAKGEKATFVVQIQYRQNSTWQGKILWAEKNESKPFRSALEMIKLIDSALDEDEAQQK